MSSYSVSKRNSNIEALRVLSMLLIILLHFFYQGGILKTIKPQDGIHFYIVWTLEAFALVSVNCFILISGYFLCEAKFKLKKICLLLLQIWFYSVVLYLVCCAFKYDTFNIKTLILVYLFPTITGKWWYASVYVALYFIFPYINLALKHLTRKQHLYLICTLVMIFSFIPVLIFFSIDTLGHLNGYSLLWFIVLYIIAAYLRKYPDSIDLKPVHYALGYIACSLCTAGIKFIQLNYRQHEYWNFYSYHSPTVLLGSICLFLFFVKIRPLPFVAFWNYIGGGQHLCRLPYPYSFSC